MRAIFCCCKNTGPIGYFGLISNLQTNVSGFQPRLAKGCLGHSEDNSDVNAMNHILGAGVPSPRLKLPIMQAAAATPKPLLSSMFTSHFHFFSSFHHFFQITFRFQPPSPLSTFHFQPFPSFLNSQNM